MDSSPTRLIDSDSAHAGMLPGQSPKSQPGAEHAPAAAASDPAADGGTANGAAAASDLARPSQWKNARGVLTAVRAAGRFATLRDLIGTDAYIEPGRLKLLKALGEGAFAHVQHAQLRPEGASEKDDSRLRDVAVKTLRQELLQDPDQIQLFVKEVALLRKLRHKHIVELIGCSWQPGSLDDSVSKNSLPKQLFYVQEYCAGGSLGDLVRRQMIQPFKKLYSDADALRWCQHIASALQYLHESRPTVIHRDLKLENVMLSSATVAEADAKLGDFGLARLQKAQERQKMDRLTKLLSKPRKEWDSNTQQSSKSLEAFLDRMLTGQTSRTTSARMGSSKGGLSSARSRKLASGVSVGAHSMLSSTGTLAGALVSTREMTGKTGSFGYMAPEVSREQQYNAQADIFSLAMCMYNLFCRNIPTVQILLNGDESHLELYAAKVAEGYRPPILANVPDSVKAAIEACWKGDAELRPTARQVVEMLRGIEEAGDCPAFADSAGGKGCCVVM